MTCLSPPHLLAGNLHLPWRRPPNPVLPKTPPSGGLIHPGPVLEARQECSKRRAPGVILASFSWQHPSAYLAPGPTAWVSSPSRWRTDWWKGEVKCSAETVSSWKETGWFQGFLGSLIVFTEEGICPQEIGGSRLWQAHNRVGRDDEHFRGGRTLTAAWPVVGAFYLHLTSNVDAWRASAQEKEGTGRDVEGAVASCWCPPVKLWRKNAGTWRWIWVLLPLSGVESARI